MTQKQTRVLTCLQINKRSTTHGDRFGQGSLTVRCELDQRVLRDPCSLKIIFFEWRFDLVLHIKL